MSNKLKGQVALTATINDLTKKGYDMFIPLFDDSPIDLIVYKEEKTYRIQVKYCSDGFVKNRTQYCNTKGTQINTYKENDFDYYALYNPDKDIVIYPSISFGGKFIRFNSPTTNDISFYWYEDFLYFTDNATKKKGSDFGIFTNNLTGKIFDRKDRETKRIPKEELEKLIWEKPTTEIAKELGVSDTAITKWCRFYNIEKPPRGFWTGKSRRLT